MVSTIHQDSYPRGVIAYVLDTPGQEMRVYRTEARRGQRCHGLCFNRHESHSVVHCWWYVRYIFLRRSQPLTTFRNFECVYVYFIESDKKRGLFWVTLAIVCRMDSSSGQPETPLHTCKPSRAHPYQINKWHDISG